MTVSPALAALDAPWFARALGAPVTSVAFEPLAFTGATTDLARFRLGGPEAGRAHPASVIAKITGTDEVRAGMDAAMGLFAREGHFYTHYAARVPIRTAACYFVGDGVTTPLLLEDLGGLRMGDQIAGLEVADAEAIIDALAAHHGRFWQAPELEEDWLVDPASGSYGAMVAGLVATGAAALQERFAGQGVDDVLEAVGTHAQAWGAVLERGVEGPLTFAHNDVRLDNVFFTDDGQPILLDWQAPARTRGTQDVANLLAQSMEPDLLAAHWRALLERYHAGLLEHGVRDYPWEQCVDHYRQNVPYALGAAMALMGAMAIDDGRGLGEAIGLRALRHIKDIDAFAAL